MTDRRFFSYAGPFSLTELAAMVGAHLSNCADPSILIDDIMPLGSAGNSHLSFMENERYRESLAHSKAGACLISEIHASGAPADMVLLLTDRPRQNFARISQRFYPDEMPGPGLHATASIAASARVGKDCRIDAGAVVGENVSIGDGCWLGANCVIGDWVRIGPVTRIGSNASLSHCDIGARCFIYSGVRIGQPGFGFERDHAGVIKMPQLGRVVIEDDVEIGANSTVDRGSGPDTIIGRGTMIDNLVQIGHNVQIGKGCIIVSMVGIAGSTTVGDHVVIAGQSGVAGHLDIGNGVRIAARSGVTKNIKDGETVGGMPAVPIRDYRRQTAVIRSLVRQARQRLGKG